MFDIAWSELFLILVVALVVVGPKDLPKLMRNVGQWAGRARAMADQFRRSFDDMARQAELDELRSEVNRLKSVATEPLSEIESAMYPKDPLGIQSTMDDVGGALPKFDEPVVPAGATPAEPVVEPAAAPETPKLESSPTSTAA